MQVGGSSVSGMNVNGLPLHPLVVHLVIVLAPTAALLAITYGLVPRWRWWSRLPLLVASIVGALATYVAAASGDSLKEALGERSQLIEVHEMWAGRLQASMWVLALVAVVAWWVLPVITPLEGRSDRAARFGALATPLRVVLPIVGLVAIFLVFKTGDAGARAVWAG